MSDGEWREFQLDEVCLNITDGSHISPPSTEKGYYMASVKDMGEYGFDFQNCRMISETDYMKLIKNGCQPQYGDVLIGKDGARYLEDVFVFKQDTKVVLLSSIAILRPDKTKMISEFLYYFLRNKDTRIDIKNNYGSGSAIPRMVLRDFKKVAIPVPPLIEQKAIAATLSCLDDKIELNNRINQTLEEMAQAIFKSWFVDFEPFQDGEFEDSELGRIPKGWRVGCIGDVCQSISETHSFKKDRLIFLNTSDIFEGQILHNTYSDVSKMPGQAKKSIAKGDILYSEIRPQNKRYTFVNIDSKDYVVSTKLMVLRAKKDKINSRRLYTFLTSENVIRSLQIIAEGRSGTFPQITFSQLAALKIVMPPNDIEHEVGLLYEKIYDLIDHNNSEIINLKSIRDSLLPKLMSGEIRVPVEET